MRKSLIFCVKYMLTALGVMLLAAIDTSGDVVKRLL